MSRKLLAAVLAVVLTGWLLQGCVPSGAEMTPATASTLQRDVDEVVSAADASRWDAAIDALDQLDADVASAQAAGRLSDQRATQIRAVRQRVLEDLQRIRLSTTPRPTATTQTTPSPETTDNGGHGDENDEHSGKSKDDDQGENGNGKHQGKNKGWEPLNLGPQQACCIPHASASRLFALCTSNVFADGPRASTAGGLSSFCVRVPRREDQRWAQRDRTGSLPNSLTLR